MQCDMFSVCQLFVEFGKMCTVVSSPPQSGFRKFLPLPRFLHVPTVFSLLSPSASPANRRSVTVLLLFLEFHRQGTTQPVLFYIWLFLLSIKLWGLVILLWFDYFVPFYCRLVFHCMDVSVFLFPSCVHVSSF